MEVPPELLLLGGLTIGAQVPESACTPDGLKGLDVHGFTGGWAADEMPAGPLLAILAEQAATGPTPFGRLPECEMLPSEAAAQAASLAAGERRLAGIPGVPGAAGARELTCNELLGAISAAARLSNRAEWMRLALASELIRRRSAESDILKEQWRDMRGRPHPGILDPANSVAEELRFQQVLGPHEADEQYGLAVSVPSRMPQLNARAADGLISPRQLKAVHRATAELTDEDARLIDAALAPDAHERTAEQLGKRARALAMKLDPQAADRRKKKGKKEARVESWQEDSGNAALAGRELDPTLVLAANAYYDAIARLLHRAGIPGTLTELRALAFADRNIGKDPLDRIKDYQQAEDGTNASDAKDGADASGTDRSTSEPAGDPCQDGFDYFPDGQRYPDLADDWRGTTGSGSPDKEWTNDAPPGIHHGLHDDGYREPQEDEDDAGDTDDNAKDDARGDRDDENRRDEDPFRAVIHLLVPAETLAGLSGAPGESSRMGLHSPRATRDLVRAASRHPKTRWRVTLVGPDGTAIGHARPAGQHPWTSYDTGPPGERVARLLDWLGVTSFIPVAKGTCDHASHEDRYEPGDELTDLIRARNATCVAPGCGAKAVHCDLDHTRPWPDGPTCQCGLGPLCRRHHKVKQSAGWRLEQPAPGTFRWAAPSGRTYTVRPTVYDL